MLGADVERAAPVGCRTEGSGVGSCRRSFTAGAPNRVWVADFT
jgi:hypothetical protein